MVTTEPIDEALPQVMTADEVYEIARRGALSALVDAGVIDKKAMALALVNGTVAGVEVKTANQLKTTPKLPKTTTPPVEPTEEQKAAANKWHMDVDKLDADNISAWQRHYLLLRDGLPGISDPIKTKMLNRMVKVAFDKWIDYDPTTQRFSPAVRTADPGNPHNNPLA
ncbi:hypothetical protein [Fibrella forsythiae]|uniref:Uncharacterized protein n=1 Tax=Fibrella forsythiae TaxID=2817061 RepID=A0ABS3JBH4_9BACT|nr:hypothetical protein [Fibrella forsythiae]MBO0947348.1 hypothetical protein [Fibrella forsythiae]